MTSFSKTRAAPKKPIVARFLVVSMCSLSSWTIAISSTRAQALHEVQAAKKICESGSAARVARAQRLAGAARVIEADVLPNPSLVVEHQRAFRGATEHESILGISMPLGIAGRRSLLQDSAAAREQQAGSEADTILFESALEFRQAYAAAVIDRARVEVLARQQAVLDELSTLIAGLAKGGEAAEYDLLRQRMHARQHRQSLESAKARAQASLVRLHAWWGEEIRLPEVALFELAGGASGDARSVDALATPHSSVLGLEAEARASAAELQAANRRWVPDLELFAGYRTTTFSRDTGHGVALSLSVPLTFFDHGQGEAARARAEQELALATAESLRRQYTASLRAADARLEVLRASAKQAEATTADAATLQDKAKQLYAAGEATITELLEAFRAAEEARLGLIDLAEDLAATRLMRMHAAGTQLDPKLDKACHVTQRRAQ